MASPLSSDQLNAAARAILARRAHLRAEWYTRACEMTATEAKTKAKLLDLNLAIAILTNQYLDDPVPHDPGAALFQPIHAIEWYAEFLAALVNTCQFVQRALALTPRELTPRTETRFPIWTAEIDAWAKRDIGGAVSAANRAFWENPLPLGSDSPAWPDHAARAPDDVYIDQAQFTELTKRPGLEPPPRNDATEAPATETEPSPPAANPSNAPPASDDERDYKPKETKEERNARIVARHAELKKKNVRNFNKVLAEEFDLSKTAIKGILRQRDDQPQRSRSSWLDPIPSSPRKQHKTH